MGDEPLCKCIAYKEMNTINTTLCEIHGTSAPSPTRDEAEARLSTEDLATIRQIIREEIEASQPKITLKPPRTRAKFLEDWEREQAWRRKSRRWFR